MWYKQIVVHVCKKKAHLWQNHISWTITNSDALLTFFIAYEWEYVGCKKDCRCNLPISLRFAFAPAFFSSLTLLGASALDPWRDDTVDWFLLPPPWLLPGWVDADLDDATGERLGVTLTPAWPAPLLFTGEAALFLVTTTGTMRKGFCETTMCLRLLPWLSPCSVMFWTTADIFFFTKSTAMFNKASRT